MRNIFYFILLSLSFNTLAAEKVDQQLDVDANGTVIIENPQGKVIIVGWSENKIKVTGTLDELSKEFIFSSDKQHTFIKVVFPESYNNYASVGSNLKIMLPKSSKVRFSTISSQVNISQLTGNIWVKSISGNVVLADVKGNTVIDVISGNVELFDLDGSLDLSTVSGSVNADIVCEQVNIRGVSAPLNVKLEKIESAMIKNVSGDSVLSGFLLPSGAVNMSNVSGSSTYRVFGNPNANVSLDAGPDGKLGSDYASTKIKKGLISSRLKTTLGNGNGSIKISTVIGLAQLKASN